jgi:hypothetical protein
MTITAPTASAAAPLTIAVRIDASILPAGVTASNAVLFRNGAPVPACTGPSGTADPDPCITERLSLGDGDIQLTALTSRASDWTVGFATVRADAGGPYLVDEGSSLTLDGTRSSNPTGGPLSYRWAPDSLLRAPTSSTPIFTAVDDGEFRVALTITAGSPGPDDTDTATVLVRNVPPEVSAIVEPARRRAREAATYTARFSDAGVADTHTVVWEWGDGTTSVGTIASVKKATAASGTHTYAAKGRYTIKLTITDDDGGVTAVQKTVTVG